MSLGSALGGIGSFLGGLGSAATGLGTLGAVAFGTGKGGNGLSGHDAYIANRDQQNFHWQLNNRHKYRWNMLGMREAGLNPILAANGGFSPGQVSGQQTAQPTRAQEIQAKAAIRQQNLNSAKLIGELKLLEAQKDKLNAETDTEKTRPENVRSQTSLNRQKIKTLGSEAVKLDEQAKVLAQDSGLRKEQIQETLTRTRALRIDVLMKRIGLEVAKEGYPTQVKKFKLELARMKQSHKIWQKDEAVYLRLFQELFGTANIGAGAHSTTHHTEKTIHLNR